MQELAVQQYALALEQTDLQISDTKTQYNANVNSQISQINNQLDEINNSLKKYRLSKEYQKITAPVSGFVNSISVNTIGETVTSAEQLVTIVPDNMPVEMICYVKNMDIADIKIGMETEVKLEAYPYNKYGTVKAQSSISVQAHSTVNRWEAFTLSSWRLQMYPMELTLFPDFQEVWKSKLINVLLWNISLIR